MEELHVKLYLSPRHDLFDVHVLFDVADEPVYRSRLDLIHAGKSVIQRFVADPVLQALPDKTENVVPLFVQRMKAAEPLATGWGLLSSQMNTRQLGLLG